MDGGEGAVGAADHGVNGVVVNEGKVNIKAFLEHEAHDPVFDSFAEAGAVAEGFGHVDGLLYDDLGFVFTRIEIFLKEAAERNFYRSRSLW